MRDHRNDLRNDVPGALDDDGVADANVFSGDLVLVVQGGVGDDHAADGHRLELGHWRQRARAPDLDFDVAQIRRRLFGGEFVRHRPARRARDKAEPLLQGEIVDLVDDAVDVVAERGALAPRSAEMRDHLLRGNAEHRQRIDRQPEALEGGDHAELGVGGQRAVSPQA